MDPQTLWGVCFSPPAAATFRVSAGNVEAKAASEANRARRDQHLPRAERAGSCQRSSWSAGHRPGAGDTVSRKIEKEN